MFLLGLGTTANRPKTDSLLLLKSMMISIIPSHLTYPGNIKHTSCREVIMFNVNDAHKNMTNLTQAQAQKWTLIANAEAERLKKLPETKNWEVKKYSVKKANLALKGKREERI